MLSESLSRVMLRMRLGFLRKMFITVREDSKDLTPMEIFCLEGIEALERPTMGTLDMMAVTTRVEISAILDLRDSRTLSTMLSRAETTLGSRRLVHLEAASVRLSTAGTMTVLNRDTAVLA